MAHQINCHECDCVSFVFDEDMTCPVCDEIRRDRDRREKKRGRLGVIIAG